MSYLTIKRGKIVSTREEFQDTKRDRESGRLYARRKHRIKQRKHNERREQLSARYVFLPSWLR